jgi:hypothetical protein
MQVTEVPSYIASPDARLATSPNIIITWSSTLNHSKALEPKTDSILSSQLYSIFFFLEAAF